MSKSIFGDAIVKAEGTAVGLSFGLTQEQIDNQPKALYETTWVEHPMPVALEDMAHAVLRAMVNQWLIANGFEEEED